MATAGTESTLLLHFLNKACSKKLGGAKRASSNTATPSIHTKYFLAVPSTIFQYQYPKFPDTLLTFSF